jgi:hypothetical protein
LQKKDDALLYPSISSAGYASLVSTVNGKEKTLISFKVSDFPSDYPPFTAQHHDRKPDGSKWEPQDILSHGGSCVVGPLGTFISAPVWDKEDIILATLKRSDLAEARVNDEK